MPRKWRSYELLLLDASGERFFHITAPWVASIVGYIIALSTMNTGARYLSLFLFTTGYAG